MSYKEVKELRKAGKLEDAISLAQQELENDPTNIWNKRSVAWVYHDFLKTHSSVEQFDIFVSYLEKIVSLEFPSDEKMIFDNCLFQVGKLVFAFSKKTQIDYSKIDKLFSIVKQFHLTKPSESYSFLYKAFHKLYKTWSKYLDFANWWCFDNFDSQDFSEVEFKGRTSMSIVEQAYIAYSKKLLEGETINSNGVLIYNSINREKITDFMLKLDAIIDNHPEYQYPPYYKAKMLLALGDNENVLSAFIPFAKQKQNDFWVWDLMAEIFSKDKELSFACYCKALSLRTPEDFLVKLHQKFASLLVEKKMYQEAKTEIKKLVSVLNKNGWKLPTQVNEWLTQNWYANTKCKNTNKDLYSKYSKQAEEILFQNIEEEIIVVEFVNENKNMLNFVKDKSMHGFFNYSNIIDKPQIGDILKVRFNGDGQIGYNKVLTVKKEDIETESPAIKEFNGILRINPKGFGFVENVFIEHKLIDKNKFEDKQEIKVKAILSFNKKKDDWGWKAISINIVDDSLNY